MHSPGQSSAALITFLSKRCSARRRGCRLPRVVARQRRLGTRRRCRPRAGRRRRGSDRGTVRRPCTGPDRSTPASTGTVPRTVEKWPCLHPSPPRVPYTAAALRSALFRRLGLAARPRRPRHHRLPRGRERLRRRLVRRRSPTFSEQIFDEIKTRTQETDLSVPVRGGRGGTSPAPSRGARLPDPLPPAGRATSGRSRPTRCCSTRTFSPSRPRVLRARRAST